jgi:hypothetical protein
VKVVRAIAIALAIIVGLGVLVVSWAYIYDEYFYPLRPGLTEEDIPAQKDRAFFACQDDAWDTYGFGVRFDVDEIHYIRRYNRVEMDVRVGGRPMECTAFFERDAPLVIEDALVTRRE